MDITIKAKLLACNRNKFSKLVFQDLTNDRYVMLTLLPNWQEDIPQIGEVGYLSYEKAVRGTEYINDDLETGVYKYDKLYFKNFVQESSFN
jgi:hypothetical protein